MKAIVRIIINIFIDDELTDASPCDGLRRRRNTGGIGMRHCIGIALRSRQLTVNVNSVSTIAIIKGAGTIKNARCGIDRTARPEAPRHLANGEQTGDLQL